VLEHQFGDGGGLADCDTDKVLKVADCLDEAVQRFGLRAGDDYLPGLLEAEEMPSVARRVQALSDANPLSFSLALERGDS
jgi:hypothetical protein